MTIRALRPFLIAFASGVAVAIIAAVAIRDGTVLVLVSEWVSIFAIVFGIAFLTGISLGSPSAITGHGTPVRPGTGVRCLLFAAGVWLGTLACVAAID
jgi:hypothetical protein